ncbi:MAG: hypothetical protein P8010_04365 [Desulfosarcinaceae bacterium]|jgi:hypothetical protein
MGIIDTLERLLVPGRRSDRQVDLKEIYCKRRDADYLKRYRTAAVGTTYRNVDGSERQQALETLKEGQRLRLVWDVRKENKILLLKGGGGAHLDLSNCIGRLNDKVAAEVLRGVSQETRVPTARVAKITGGTRKRPKLGCVVELSIYPVA